MLYLGRQWSPKESDLVCKVTETGGFRKWWLAISDLLQHYVFIGVIWNFEQDSGGNTEKDNWQHVESFSRPQTYSRIQSSGSRQGFGSSEPDNPQKPRPSTEGSQTFDFRYGFRSCSRERIIKRVGSWRWKIPLFFSNLYIPCRFYHSAQAVNRWLLNWRISSFTQSMTR